MYDIFHATICGRATDDAIARTTSSATQMATFSMAINTDSSPTFVSVVSFGSLAKFVLDKIKKGDRLTIIGDVKQVEKNGKSYISVNATSIFPGTYSQPQTKENWKSKQDISDDELRNYT